MTLSIFWSIPLTLLLVTLNVSGLSLQVTDSYGKWHALHAQTNDGRWAWGAVKVVYTSKKARHGMTFPNELKTFDSPSSHLYSSTTPIDEIDYYFYSGTDGNTYICSGAIYQNPRTPPDINNHGGCHFQSQQADADETYHLILNATGPSN
jgi:hypothetical protein